MPEKKSVESIAITRNLITVVCAMLDGYRYTYQELDATSLQLAIGNAHGMYQLFFTAADASDFVRLTGHYGSRVPADRRTAVAEAITRINWIAGIGGFDMDFSDGDVRYRIGMDVENGLLSEKMADNMLVFCIHMLDKYHEPLMRIAFGDADPETAIVEVP